MTLWLVRAGNKGQQEQIALDKGIATIGGEEIPDLSQFNNRTELQRKCEMICPDAKKMRIVRLVGQLWDFSKEIKINDLVALPLKTQSIICIGKVIGDYKYNHIAPDILHTRKVEWLKKIPRSAFDQDLLYSLGAFTTVCRIKRNDAERRISKMLDEDQTINRKTDLIVHLNQEYENNLEVDIEEFSRDDIIKFIESKFSGHGLARIIESILKAQGYVTLKSEPGKDGGVDILAGSGPWGLMLIWVL
jgi:restriction system protein